MGTAAKQLNRIERKREKKEKKIYESTKSKRAKRVTSKLRQKILKQRKKGKAVREK